MIFAGALKEKLDFYKIVETQSASGFKKTEEQYMFTCNAYRQKTKRDSVLMLKRFFTSMN